MSRTVFVVLTAAALTLSASAQHKSSKLGAPIFPLLAYVNLDAELGLETELLRGFGLRVDDARRAADPGVLAGQAVLLGFAEELAGRTAKSVTAVQVLGEAARIAEEQQSTEAAKAVVAASRKITGGESVAQRMNAAMGSFIAMRGEGEFIGYIKVANGLSRVLDVYIDGKYAGFLYGGETNTYSTGNGTTQVRVTDAFGNTASEIVFVKQSETFSWDIAP